MHAAHLDDEINQFALFFFAAYAPNCQRLAPLRLEMRAILAGDQEVEMGAPCSGFEELMRIESGFFCS
jgi:hypothetical protein